MGYGETYGPLLEAIGRKLVVIGADPPSANTVKLAGNFLIASMLETLAEAFALVMLGPAKSKKHCQRNHQKRKHVQGKQRLSPLFRKRSRDGHLGGNVTKRGSVWARYRRTPAPQSSRVA